MRTTFYSLTAWKIWYRRPYRIGIGQMWRTGLLLRVWTFLTYRNSSSLAWQNYFQDLLTKKTQRQTLSNRHSKVWRCRALLCNILYASFNVISFTRSQVSLFGVCTKRTTSHLQALPWPVTSVASSLSRFVCAYFPRFSQPSNLPSSNIVQLYTG